MYYLIIHGGRSIIESQKKWRHLSVSVQNSSNFANSFTSASAAADVSLQDSLKGNSFTVSYQINQVSHATSCFCCSCIFERRRRKSRRKTMSGDGVDMEDLFSEKEREKIRASLLEWYDVNKRELPWRKRRSEGEKERRGYEVWVSEIMLQQTRVQTVMDYYIRWMQKWPTIYDLAQASLEEVNEMWAGLGYYRRARFLLEGAKMVVAGTEGFPNQASSLMKVKGIGEYTAGAIASIAFNEAVPVVDGNVIRVLARLKAISANPKDRNTVKNFWKLAAQLVDPSRPGDFNQSLMELGATLCTPTNPTCSACPVSTHCRAFSSLSPTTPVTDYPTKVVKAKQKRDFCCVCVLEILNNQGSSSGGGGGRFVLVKRPEQGLLAGLWEFPSVILDQEPDLETRTKAINLYLTNSLHVDLESKRTCTLVSRKQLGEFLHIFTHIRRKIYVELLLVQLRGGTIDHEANNTLTWKCVDSEALSTMGLTSAVRKVYTMVEAHKSNTRVTSRKRRIPLD